MPPDLFKMYRSYSNKKTVPLFIKKYRYFPNLAHASWPLQNVQAIFKRANTSLFIRKCVSNNSACALTSSNAQVIFKQVNTLLFIKKCFPNNSACSTVQFNSLPFTKRCFSDNSACALTFSRDVQIIFKRGKTSPSKKKYSPVNCSCALTSSRMFCSYTNKERLRHLHYK